MGMKYLTGDLPEGTTTSVMFGQPMLTIPTDNIWRSDTIILKDHVQSVEIVTEENKKQVLNKVAWGAVGLVAFGPLAAIAGLLLGGNKREVCFICGLKDGRSFMATANSKTYQTLLASSFSSKS